MISHKHNFIFIFPPKTGSTSILRNLLPYAEIRDVLQQPQWNTIDFYEHVSDFKQEIWNKFTKKKRSDDPRKHSNLDSYPEKHIENYQIFCVVRNPFERILSMWKWEKSVKGIFRGVDYRQLNFDQFLYNHTMDWYFKPQYEFIYTDSMDMNCINLIRFENLQQDFDIVCDKIGIERRQLPHINKSNHKHYTEYYDDETRQIVAERYAKDIEYFGYKFN